MTWVLSFVNNTSPEMQFGGESVGTSYATKLVLLYFHAQNNEFWHSNFQTFLALKSRN